MRRDYYSTVRACEMRADCDAIPVFESDCTIICSFSIVMWLYGMGNAERGNIAHRALLNGYRHEKWRMNLLDFKKLCPTS